MSCDFGVFYTTKPLTAKEAEKRYIAYWEESDLAPYIEPSPKINDFVSELTASHPQIDDTPDDQLHECPWTIAFDLSDGHVIMCVAWDKVGATEELIVDLAEKHGLVCFDPQSSKILTAPAGIHVHVQPKPWWKLWS